MWIKICGNTSLADAQQAASAGASALGFIFAPSPRRVSVDQVRAITPHLPRNVERFGVFSDASFEEIITSVDLAGLNGIQLHRNHDPELPNRLRAHYTAQRHPEPISIVAVVHFTGNIDQQLANVVSSPAVDAVLIDSRTATAYGGTGTRYDWEAARPTFLKLSQRTRMIAAGGMTPESIGEAIQTLEPWGVDVVSGVEGAPGRKDPMRVTAFIRNARQAFAALEAPMRTGRQNG